METEGWKTIPGYEGFYQASNLGNIKSLKREIVGPTGRRQKVKERILKGYNMNKGYLMVTLRTPGDKKKFLIHQLVAMAWLDHDPKGMTKVVDHINNDKSDNRAVNLQVVSQRDNCTKDKAHKGVYKSKQRWVARTWFEGKTKHIGIFDTCQEALDARSEFLMKSGLS